MALLRCTAQTIFLAILLVIPNSTFSPVLAEKPFALVINHSNPYAGNRAEAISVITRLFLKKAKMWPNSDVTCRPFDRADRSVEHQHFTKYILKMSSGKLLEHWAKMKQLRGDTPPRKIASTRILLKLIQKNTGAFGIVKQEDANHLPKGVKVLFYF